MLPSAASRQTRADLGISVARIGLRRFDDVEARLRRLFDDRLSDVGPQAGPVLSVLLSQQDRLTEAIAVTQDVADLCQSNSAQLAANTTARLVYCARLGEWRQARDALTHLVRRQRVMDASDGLIAWWSAWALAWRGILS